jgi:hypothetical protein
MEHKMQALICSKNLSETSLILTRIEQGIVTLVQYTHRSSCKVTVFLVRF